MPWRSKVRGLGAVCLAPALVATAAMPSGARPPDEDLVLRASSGTPTQEEAATAGTTRDAASVLAAMTLPQRVGQLFMVGTPATSVDEATRRQISRYHVGNVMLTERSYGGTVTPARVAATMQKQVSRSSTAGVGLLVSADQEGGQVQALQGRGISEIPSALRQGTLGADQLRTASMRWARELRESGVNINLAPVLDTVPSPEAAQDNPPIGAHDRQYGYTLSRVARKGAAFLRGMRAGGVVPVAKHFPGLGRVQANTDTSSGVTDPVTRRGDAHLRSFQASVDAGVPFVMMSSAFYSRLDRRNPAVFSPFVIGTVLRRDLGFSGVVISDDLANARQVSPWRPGVRAVKFVAAGGDMVLTVSSAPLPAMYEAVLNRARNNAAFRAKVNRAALRVLRAKEKQGLLGR